MTEIEEGDEDQDEDVESKHFVSHTQALQQILDSFSWWRSRIQAKRRLGKKKHTRGGDAEVRDDDDGDSSSSDDESSDGEEWESDPGHASDGGKKSLGSKDGQPVKSVAALNLLKETDEESVARPWGLVADDEASEARDKVRNQFNSDQTCLILHL